MSDFDFEFDISETVTTPVEKPLPKKTTRKSGNQKIPENRPLKISEQDIAYRGDVTYDIPETFVKHFDVIDPETGDVVGQITYPDAPLCPGMSCEMSEGKSHSNSFTHKGMFWIHTHCGKPNDRSATSRIREVIEFKEGYKLPWERESDE